jgi:NAD(P)-dependent dehydrogenase (short-subunit alcohol dehydrogenase family)
MTMQRSATRSTDVEMISAPVMSTAYRAGTRRRRAEPIEAMDLVRYGHACVRYGDHVRAVALDVTDPAAARAAVQNAVDAFGRLDVLVNNAGYADIASFEDFTDGDFRAQIDTKFYGVVNVTRAALPMLREQGSGHIVQISSVGGRLGTRGLSA